MKLRNLSVFILILLLFSILVSVSVSVSFISCSKKSDNKGIELDMKILPDTVTDSLYIKMNYRFTFTDKFPGLDDDYMVFVHFWRPKNKEMLLQDDHKPEKGFSQWKAGDPVSYSRVVFLPQFLDEFDIDFEGYEEVKLTIGVFKPADKENKIILYQEVLNIQSASLNAPEMVYDEGWNQPETDLKIKNPDEQTWRWTKKKAVCIIENPRKESLLIIKGGVDKAKFADQKVILKINDNLLEEFIPPSAKFTSRYVITPGMMGTEDEFRLTIETDKTFVPSALNPGINDDRELGLQVYFLYFRENIR